MNEPGTGDFSGHQGRGNNTLATIVLFVVAGCVLLVLRTTTDVPYLPRILLSLGAGLVAALVVFLLTGRRRSDSGR